MARGVFTVQGVAQTVATAITLLELTAPAASTIEILRAWVNSSANTDVMNRVRVLKKTATITGTASPPTPVQTDGGSGSSGCTVKWLATAEGTDGSVFDDDYFHMKNGYLWVPTHIRQRWLVPPSGLIAIKFPVAPQASAVWTFGFDYEELSG